MDAHELFWDIPDDCLTCPPLTEIVLREAEQQLGFVLPKSLVAVLKIRNGGYLRPNRIYVGTDKETWPDADGEGYIGMCTLYGVGSERGIDHLYDGKPLNESLREQWGYPQNSLVIAQDGHGGFALCYQDPAANPEVICVFSECYPDVLVRTIAPNFETFLSMLEREEERPKARGPEQAQAHESSYVGGPLGPTLQYVLDRGAGLDEIISSRRQSDVEGLLPDQERIVAPATAMYSDSGNAEDVLALQSHEPYADLMLLDTRTWTGEIICRDDSPELAGRTAGWYSVAGGKPAALFCYRHRLHVLYDGVVAPLDELSLRLTKVGGSLRLEATWGERVIVIWEPFVPMVEGDFTMTEQEGLNFLAFLVNIASSERRQVGILRDYEMKVFGSSDIQAED